MKRVFDFNGDYDELCYPFIYESSSLCDFEILTDELCTVTGLAGTNSKRRDKDVQAFLFELQPFIFDLNGSIRGRCTIEAEQLNWLKQQLLQWRSKLENSDNAFVLPRGSGSVIQIHYCRSLSKKVVRALVNVKKEGIDVPEHMPRFANVLVNLYFILTRIVNQRDDVEEPEYVSRNYSNKSKPSC